MRLPLPAVTFVLTVLLARPLHAESTSLGEVLEAYRRADFNIVYSTDLVDEARTVSWESGHFSVARLEKILASAGLRLRAVGKRTWIITTTPPRDATVPLTSSGPPGEYIEHIVVSASLHEIEGRQHLSRFLVSDAKMEQTPAFAGDSLRIIHRLPGAATIGVSSRPNVRGGVDDELLVVFDGVELIEPFHLRDFQSLLSTINPQTVSNIEFFTGGFPARYGNKISGVLDIATRDAFDAPGGELGVSTFQTAGLIFSESGGNQWIASARRGNLDLLLNEVNPAIGKPRYYDLYGKYAHESPSLGRLEISALGFYDNAHLDTDEVAAESDRDNQYLWTRWSREFDDGVYVSASLSTGRVEGIRQGLAMAEDRTQGSLFDDHELQITTLAQQLEWRATSWLKLGGGLSVTDLDMDYRTRVEAETGIIAELLGNPRTIERDILRSFDGLRTGAHFSAKVQATDKLSIRSGFRLDWQSYLDVDTEFQFSPRLALLYTPAPNLLLRLSFGRFQQPPGIHELETADGEVSFANVQQADHWIAGLEYQWSRSRFEAEVFYKSISDPGRRFENLFNPYVLLPELEPDRIEIQPEKAYAKGLELGYYGGYEPFTWMLNYSWSEVQDRVEGRWIHRRWDQTHNVNAVLNWQSGPWTLGVAGVWHTGWTMTVLPAELAAGEFSISRYRSNDRIKDYATLDLRVAYEFPFSRSTLTGFLEVTNLVSRSNKGGVDYEIVRENDVYLLEEVDLEPVFPLVSAIGIIWRF